MDNKIQNKGIQTYKEDMTKAVTDNKAGMIKKIIEEQEKYDSKGDTSSPESKKNKIFMLVSLILLTAALVIFIFFSAFKKDIFTVDVPLQFQPPIFIDNTAFKEIGGLSKDVIADTVLNEVYTTKVKSGGVEGLYLTVNKKIVGFRKFLELIKSSFIVGEPTFVSDNFLMGIANKETKDFFILIKIRSVPDVFRNMQAWEGKMFSELHGFFGVNLNSDTNYLISKTFEDSIIENKNARILYDKEGKIALIYVFADDNSILITNTEKTTSEIMLRLKSGQIKK